MMICLKFLTAVDRPIIDGMSAIFIPLNEYITQSSGVSNHRFPFESAITSVWYWMGSVFTFHHFWCEW
jgi:hypothetical protein